MFNRMVESEHVQYQILSDHFIYLNIRIIRMSIQLKLNFENEIFQSYQSI